MKIVIVSLVAFMLGFGAYWGYGQYNSLIKENQELKRSEKTIPSSADESSVSAALTPTKSLEDKGSISGSLGYPSEVIPELEVYAFDIEDQTKYFSVKTSVSQQKFTIENIDPGSYFIVAYTLGFNGLAGGYTKAVSCGLTVDCTDHSLISVDVKAGEDTSNIEVKDWYAPEGLFPKKP